MKSFGNQYAKYYDIIYSDKDYKGECEFLERIFRKYSKKNIMRILDAGCGTGGHALHLAKKGYTVTGIDGSEYMIQIAKDKAMKLDNNIIFKEEDLRNFDLQRKFDSSICMFSVINYFTTYNDLEKVFLCIRNHLIKGALFIFDFWYGPAVLNIKPEPKRKTVKKEDLKIIRLADPHLNIKRNLCTVEFDTQVIRGNNLIYSKKENHVIRYYFLQEIEYFLRKTGFKLELSSSFLNLDVEPNEHTWDVTAIARAN